MEVFKATQHSIAVHCFNEDLKEDAWKVVESLREIKDLL